MSYIGNQPTNIAFVTDTFSGTGSQTAFTMSVAPASTSSVLVAVTGVLQDPSTYSVSGTTLTFSAAPPSGTGNISCRYLGVPASGVTTTAYRTVTNFTATAGQTTFTPPSYTVGYIDVYRNGSKLALADFTATNGTTVVLTAAASAGDVIETDSFYVSSVLNAIPNTAGAVSQSNLAAGLAGNGPSFRAYGSAQSMTGGVSAKVQNNGESWDTANCYDNATNYRFTPNVAGYYTVNVTVVFPPYSGAGATIVYIYKNGSNYSYFYNNAVAGYTNGASHTDLVYCNGSTDYIEMYALPNETKSTTSTYFSAALVRAA
jgi:hypothetical protein